MSEKEMSASSWLQADMVKNIVFGLLLCTGLYGVYYLLQYSKRQSAYKQNLVLAQALDEYQKAQQGYTGSWETLKEIAEVGAVEQSGTIVAPYLNMLQAQAQQHVEAAQEEIATEDLVNFAWEGIQGKSNSLAMQDLLAISNALAGLDRAHQVPMKDAVAVGSSQDAVDKHIKTLESFFERLTGVQEPCEHYFDDYASYMLAYYWYSQGKIEKAQEIWTAVAATVQEGQDPTVWQQLSQSFLS